MGVIRNLYIGYGAVQLMGAGDEDSYDLLLRKWFHNKPKRFRPVSVYRHGFQGRCQNDDRRISPFSQFLGNIDADASVPEPDIQKQDVIRIHQIIQFLGGIQFDEIDLHVICEGIP